MRPFDPRLLRRARAAGGYLGVSAIVALMQGVAIVAFAWGAGTIVASAVQGSAIEPLPTAVAAVSIIIRGACSWLDSVVAARAAVAVRTQLREQALQTLSDYRVGTSSSDVATTVSSGLDALDGYFSDFLPQLVRTAVITPVIVAALCVWDLFTGIAVLICLPLIPMFMVLIGLATQRVQARQWDATKGLAGRFLEILEGTATLKLFRRDRRAAVTIRAASDEHRKRTNAVLRISFVSSMVLELAASLSIALVAVSIGVRLIEGEIALALAFGVLILTPDAFLPVRMVGGAFHASTEGVEAIRDCLDIIETPEADRIGLPESADGGRGLLVQSVTAAGASSPPLSFAARHSTVTVVRGPSGAGKTTAVRALAGLVPAVGTASIDGRALRRGDIAYMQQSSWDSVVTGTVRDNLLLGGPEADQGLRHLLDQVGVDADLDAVTEPARGGRLGLSGGQAQRVALVRAVLRTRTGARVLIADEPTSALDSDGERRCAELLRDTADSGAIVIVVTHRDALAAIADQVVSLETVLA